MFLSVKKNGRETELIKVVSELKKQQQESSGGRTRLVRSPRQNKRDMGSHAKRRDSDMQNIISLGELDLVATICAAAAWSSFRKEQIVKVQEAAYDMEKELPAVLIQKSDFRRKKYQKKNRTGILFVVDASRSQGTEQRLSFAKGAVLTLLSQAYVSRDKVGLLLFGNGGCELAVPMTSSVEFAADRLRSLPAAGNTPLGMGLRKALEVLEQERKKDSNFTPLIIVLTDGKANYDEIPGVPLDLAFQAAERIAKAQIPALVVNTETGVFGLGIAEKVAEKMKAECVSLF